MPAPVRVEAQAVTESSAEIHAWDTSGTDIFRSCELSTNDGASWHDSNKITGLSPETACTVLVRVEATDRFQASAAKPVTFTTLSAEDPGEGPEKIWIAEYDLVQVFTRVADGLGVNNDVFTHAESNYSTGIDHSGPATEAANEELMAYIRSMYDPDAPYNDKWDSITTGHDTVSYKLVPTGGHWETVKSTANREKLYFYNKSEVFDEQVQPSVDVWTFTTSKGIFHDKKEAWANGPIQNVDLGTNSEPYKTVRVLTLEMMGAKAGEAWCYTGETLATMDGNTKN